MKNWLKRLVGNDSCEVHFEGGPIVVVDSGTTIMDASKQADVEIDSFCGGNCSCSTCKVMISDGAKCLSKVSAEEQTVLGQPFFLGTNSKNGTFMAVTEIVL